MYARSVGRWIDFQKPIGNSKGFQRKCVFLDKDPKKKDVGSARVVNVVLALEAAMVTVFLLRLVTETFRDC